MDKVLEEANNYIYSNPLIRWVTMWGHRVCQDLSSFDKPGCTLLDLGCGTGEHLELPIYSRVIGLDMSRSMLCKDGFSLVQGTALGLPLKGNSVNSVVASGLLEHIEDLGTLLCEVKRVLVPGGELLLLQPCEGSLYRLFRRLTIQRVVERRTGESYDTYIKGAHIHTCEDILDVVSGYFRFDRVWGVPFRLPILSVNAYVAVRFVKE